MTSNVPIFEHPNTVLGEELSPSTLGLMDKLKKDTGFSVRFERFEDHEKYHSCKHYAGGSIGDDKVPTVYLNCSKVSGYVNLIVSHELLHISLDREGYPTPKYKTGDKRAEEVASLVRSILEHPIIQQRQLDMDHSDIDFQDEQVRTAFSCLPSNENLVLEGLRYVEYKLMCKDEGILKKLDDIYSKYAWGSHGLGMELLRRYDKYGGSVKGKKAAVTILEEWVEILKVYGVSLMVAE